MTDEQKLEFVIKLNDLRELIRSSKELVESISFDINGIALPNMMAGGNGGLISTKTARHCDETRRALSKLEHVMEDPKP